MAALAGSAGPADPGAQRVFVPPLRAGLHEPGGVEGCNLAIELRFADRWQCCRAALGGLPRLRPLHKRAARRAVLTSQASVVVNSGE